MLSEYFQSASANFDVQQNFYSPVSGKDGDFWQSRVGGSFLGVGLRRVEEQE